MPNFTSFSVSLPEQKTYLTGFTGFDGSTASGRSGRAARNTHPLRGREYVQPMDYCLTRLRRTGNILSILLILSKTFSCLKNP